ncbi:MAG: flagellar biosynthetic protein FliO [Acidobacteriota bacterium]|nr:flagellar biosynthetic protein FliO [Acidobacteriota bacterium]
MIILSSNFTFLLWQTTEIKPLVGWFDIVWTLLQTAFALALVCGLAILIFRYILPKLNVISYNKSIVRIVDGASLEARKRLVVVEAAGKYLLLAVSESGVQMITELDGAAVEEAALKLEEAKSQTVPPFKKAGESFAQIMDTVWKKKR